MVLLALVAAAGLLTASGVQSRVEPGTPLATATGPPPSVAFRPGAEGAGDPYYPTDGNGGYDVEHYRVAVSYDPPSRHLDGDTTITARATQPLSRFNLDLFGLDVTLVEVDGAPAKFERKGVHELVITPAAGIRQDASFTARVRYAGRPTRFDENGLGAGGWYTDSASGAALAAGEPHSAPTWYPANDTPRDKATFELQARVPDGWSVISNGLEQPVQAPASADGWTAYGWKLNTPTTTYLTTIAIDRWMIERGRLADGTPVVSAYAPGSEEPAQRRLPEIIDFLAGKFGPYPFEAAGGIFLGASIGYALETQSRPVYSPEPGLSIIVHENAHQWFGDSVSVRSWADICLNECFASYAQWLWSEAKEGLDLDDEYRDTVGGLNFRAKLVDMGQGNEFHGVYTKGPVALHALRRQLGDDTFFAILREWTQRHRDGNASWSQFEELVAEVSGQRLDGFFGAWFHGTSKPSDEFLWPGPLRP